ncbi:hypothetical protein L3081_08865 [Colwellia sp. MSW7]|uniref:Uncharacterized protein n=1 Tax=Colwellia maritima TaxID=2912588 RepID=A0ABS9WZN9_9GAMM|nr:hypothetical protein [Colwellia maritima]MCI2283483.1 hypothetical protein [Colwellia maritima]
MPEDYAEQQNSIITTITQKELSDIAMKELSQPMQWIVVGDGQVVRSQLEKMNLDIIELQLAK